MAVSAASAQSSSVQDPAALEAFFDGVFSVQLRQNKIPGAEVVVVAQGEIVLAKGYGFADLAEEIPMEPGITVHRPGSISKILVWLAVMQLVEQGSWTSMPMSIPTWTSPSPAHHFHQGRSPSPSTTS